LKRLEAYFALVEHFGLRFPFGVLETHAGACPVFRVLTCSAVQPVPVDAQVHSFHASAFVENFSMKELSVVFPEAKRSVRELRRSCVSGGEMWVFPFGAVVFRNVSASGREQELKRLHQARPGLTTAVINEQFTVREQSGLTPKVADGVLSVDHLTPERSSLIAITVAQSAAMEYYERIVEELFGKTDRLVERLEQEGTVRLNTRPLHRFIGAAVGTRNEVLSVLHLLDKPDETWDDPGIDRIYEGLRAEFDLTDRYQALELKLRSVQEALELVLDVARDRRLVLLELAVVGLILFEIVLSLVRH
jgi:required for meiotic nuclear division protein 1